MTTCKKGKIIFITHVAATYPFMRRLSEDSSMAEVVFARSRGNVGTRPKSPERVIIYIDNH